MMNTPDILPSKLDLFSKIIKSSDIDLFNLVEQVCELTGCSHSLASTTLLDCDYDIEKTVDKIFEHPSRLLNGTDISQNVWKEVAKTKKKPVVAESLRTEINVDVKRLNHNAHRESRGTSRGISRSDKINGPLFKEVIARCPGHGYDRQSPFPLVANRGRPRHYQNKDLPHYDDNVECDFMVEKGNHVQAIVTKDWFSDEDEPEMVAEMASAAQLVSTHTKDAPSPVEIVANCPNKCILFGDFSRTKAPAPSAIVPTEAIQLVTSSGVMGIPSRTSFHFGLDFTEFCGSNGVSLKIQEDAMKTNDVQDDVKMLQYIEGVDGIAQVRQNDISRVQDFQDQIKKVQHSRDDIRDEIIDMSKCGGDFHRNAQLENDISRRVRCGVSDGGRIQCDSNSSRNTHDNLSSSVPSHHSMNSSIVDTSYAVYNCPTNVTFTTSSQFCPPLGMSNAQNLSRSQNNPQQYLSLTNLPTDRSVFDLTELASSSSTTDCHTLHPNSSKDFMAKTHNSIKSDYDRTDVLNAMQMSNICCYPPVYMNNYPNFVSSAPGQSIETSQSNKPSLTLLAHNAYGQEQCHDTVKYEDTLSQRKYMRGQQYVANYGCNDEESHMSNPPTVDYRTDQRYMAFHPQQSSHMYPNNLYNCVTASGPQHPYSMAQQTGGIPQLHLMQQQMHNFCQSYQFQENVLPPAANNRNIISGSNGNQSRNSRSNNVWHAAH